MVVLDAFRLVDVIVVAIVPVALDVDVENVLDGFPVVVEGPQGQFVAGA